MVMSVRVAVGRGVPDFVRLHLLRGWAWVSGRWVKAASGKTFPILNPANGKLIAEAPDMGAGDTATAIETAHTAQRSWATLTCKERAARLQRWHDAMVTHREELAKIITVEAGKVLQDSRGEVDYAASFFSWFAEEAKRVEGDILPSPTQGRRTLVIRQPVGMAAVLLHIINNGV